MKFRTDFVTNSSSSSFILTICFDLKDGTEIIFNANGGTPECGRVDYFDEDAVVEVSPKELAMASDVEEMICLLTEGVIDEGWEESVKIFEKPKPYISDVDGQLYNAYDFIEEIREKIESMDDISMVSITGNEYNYVDYCREFVYNKENGKYYGYVQGYDFEKDGASGGDLRFDISDCEVECDDEEGE